jgi:hypothetical protein
VPRGAIGASFRPAGGALTIAQATLIFGVDHFNWDQQVTQVPGDWRVFNDSTSARELPMFPDHVNYNRTVTTQAGGTFEVDGTGDGNGFYWNEARIGTTTRWSNAGLTPDPFTFLFWDNPNLPANAFLAGQSMGFQTTLVGVTASEQEVPAGNAPEATFNWESDGTDAHGIGFAVSPFDGTRTPVTSGGVFGLKANLGHSTNRAPAWSGSGAALTAVPAGATNPDGDTVGTVFGSAFSDSDGDYVGAAVKGVTRAGNGTWQFSLDAGVTWTAFGAVSASSARLLSTADLVRFVPNPGFSGTTTLQAFAWDQTTGTDGGTADLSAAASTGGSTPFGSTLLTATAQVIVVLPTSSVTALPATETSTSFRVSWSGSDAGGSGIASYTIYASVDGGAFTPWLVGTTQTSATYTGAFGHSYAFFSAATDNLGHQQALPAGAQASTVLVPQMLQRPRGINAHLVTVKVGKRKKLMVEVDFADTGAKKGQIASPFQSPAFKNIQVSISDSNAGGVPDQVVLKAKRGKKTITAVFAG